MRRPSPPFLHANNIGALYGLELGTIRFDSSKILSYDQSSSSSGSLKGYNLCFGGGIVLSTNGIVNGTRFSMMG